MKALDYEKKRKREISKENVHKYMFKRKNGDQDDKISLTYSFLYSRQRLLILKILGMDFD